VHGVVGPFGPCCPPPDHTVVTSLVEENPGLVGVDSMAQWKLPERTSNESHPLGPPRPLSPPRAHDQCSAPSRTRVLIDILPRGIATGAQAARCGVPGGPHEAEYPSEALYAPPPTGLIGRTIPLCSWRTGVGVWPGRCWLCEASPCEERRVVARLDSNPDATDTELAAAVLQRLSVSACGHGGDVRLTPPPQCGPPRVARTDWTGETPERWPLPSSPYDGPGRVRMEAMVAGLRLRVGMWRSIVDRDRKLLHHMSETKLWDPRNSPMGRVASARGAHFPEVR